MFGFESLLGMLKRNSVEKLNGGIYTKLYGHTIMAVLITLVLNDFLLMLFSRTIPALCLVTPFILLVMLYLYLVNRKGLFGVTNNNFILIKLKMFWFKEKEVYEIPIEKIRYLDVKNIFGLVFVKMFFISDIGKFEKVKLICSKIVLGLDRKEYKKNYKVVVDKLLEVQKVMDKGDF